MREADRVWQRAESRVIEGRFVDLRSGRQRFGRYVQLVWLPNHVMEANTRQGYTHIVERYLLAEFGPMRTNEIKGSYPNDVVLVDITSCD